MNDKEEVIRLVKRSMEKRLGIKGNRDRNRFEYIASLICTHSPDEINNKSEKKSNENYMIIIFLLSLLKEREFFFEDSKILLAGSIFIPLKENYYYDKDFIRKYTDWGKCLKDLDFQDRYRYRLTKPALERVIKILEDLNIIEFEKKGGYELNYNGETKRAMSIITLNSDKHWKFEKIKDFSKDKFNKTNYSLVKPFENTLVRINITPISNKKSKDKQKKIYKDLPDEIKEKETSQIRLINDHYIKKQHGIVARIQRTYLMNENEGGRLDSKFHHMSKQNRKDWCDERKYKSIDRRSFNLQTLYRLTTGKYYKNDKNCDAYLELNNNLKKINLNYGRNIVKEFLLRLTGTSKRENSSRAIREVLAENQLLLSSTCKNAKIINRKTISKILGVIEYTFTEVKHLFHNEMYRILMKIESDMIVSVLLKSVENDDLIISIHDEILVPEEKKEYYEEIMEKSFLEAVEKNKEHFELFKKKRRIQL